MIMRPPTQTELFYCIELHYPQFSRLLDGLCYTHSFSFITGLKRKIKKTQDWGRIFFLRLFFGNNLSCCKVIVTNFEMKQTSMQNVQIPDIAYESMRFMFLTCFAPCMCFCRLDQSHNAVLVLQNTVPYYHTAHTHTYQHIQIHALLYSQKYTV